MIYLLHILFLFVSLHIFSDAKLSVVLRGRPMPGLFSAFTDVAAALEAYDAGKFRGLRVDFGTTGTYYEPAYGENWWNYYCAPIELGDLSSPIEGTIGDFQELAPKKWKSKHHLAALIKKYIHFLPEITEKVEDFASEHFANKKVVGVHYRGTDWLSENNFRRVNYQIFAKRVKQAVRGFRTQNYIIFIATDEKHFITYMEKTFPGKICYVEGTYRSETGLAPHRDASYDQRMQGEEAIVDCLLLSKSDFFIGTCSNLSQWATYFNLSKI